jgi:hypothetical protein
MVSFFIYLYLHFMIFMSVDFVLAYRILWTIQLTKFIWLPTAFVMTNSILRFNSFQYQLLNPVVFSPDVVLLSVASVRNVGSNHQRMPYHKIRFEDTNCAKTVRVWKLIEESFEKISILQIGKTSYQRWRNNCSELVPPAATTQKYNIMMKTQ